jgi:hypothetical protein
MICHGEADLEKCYTSHLEIAWDKFNNRFKHFLDSCESNCDFNKMVPVFNEFIKELTNIIDTLAKEIENNKNPLILNGYDNLIKLREDIHKKFKQLKEDMETNRGMPADYDESYNQTFYAKWLWILLLVFIILGFVGLALANYKTQSP